MNKKFEKIGVFDSGLGGVTVLKELIDELPNENYIYYGDNGNFPYGDGKTKKELQKITKNIVEFFVRNNCKAVIVACNTASVAAIDYLKESFSLPIIGIVEAGSRLAVNKSSSKKVAIFSTQFTANSNAYRNEIKKMDLTKEVIQIACPEFCPMIEDGWENFENADIFLKKYVSMIPNDVDTLVLACTHYPLIKDYIAKYFSKDILNPASELVKELKIILREKNLLNPSTKKGKTIFFVSGKIETFKPIAEKFLKQEIEIYKL